MYKLYPPEIPKQSSANLCCLHVENAEADNATSNVYYVGIYARDTCAKNKIVKLTPRFSFVRFVGGIMQW